MRAITVAAALIALAALPGCMTTYELTKPDGTHFRVNSFREFKGGLKAEYTSPQGAVLKVEAGEVTNGDPLAPVLPILGAAVEALKQKAEPTP